MENVQFETKPLFNLTIAEKRTMYVRMALCRFNYLRNPAYNEDLLLDKLTDDFKELSGELNRMKSEQPNNHTIYRLAVFFDLHYKNLLQIKPQKNATSVC